MRVGLIGAGLCALAGACMLAGLAVGVGSTAAKVLIVVAAALFLPGVLLTFAWMRVRMGPPR